MDNMQFIKNMEAMKKNFDLYKPKMFQTLEMYKKTLNVYKPKILQALEMHNKYIDDIMSSTKFQNFFRDLSDFNSYFVNHITNIDFNKLKGRVLFSTMKNNLWVIIDKGLFLQMQTDINSISDENFEEYICNFYLNNNCENLNRVISEIKDCGINEKRYNIIQNSLNILVKNKDEKGVCEVIIPTILAQLEGEKEDLLDILKEGGILDEAIKELDIKLKKEKLSKSQIIDVVNHHYGFGNSLLYSIIEKSVFLPGNKIRDLKNGELETELKLENFDLFRNKILHGDKDYLDYGTKENLVRCFLFIHFISFLIKKAKDNVKE
ncbi:MAG: hypothetical protein N4A44_04410 [Alphaproteobacteria bacterium]|jgi:hypothetical protein|nr:hypothetical protein [Alphaproteobacteria bacterium]